MRLLLLSFSFLFSLPKGNKKKDEILGNTRAESDIKRDNGKYPDGNEIISGCLIISDYLPYSS